VGVNSVLFNHYLYHTLAFKRRDGHVTCIRASNCIRIRFRDVGVVRVPKSRVITTWVILLLIFRLVRLVAKGSFYLLSVCLSVRMYQRGCHWTDCREI